MHTGTSGLRAPHEVCTIEQATPGAVQDAEEDLRHAGVEGCGRQNTERVRQLAAGIAHNFNNLLTSMMCGSELALSRLANDHPARAAAELSYKASEQAADLVRQLMAYAGIEVLVVLPADLSLLANHAIVSLPVPIPRRVNLRVDLAGGPPRVSVDSRAIEQLIHALLANAFEAIGDNSGTVSISTRTAKASAPLAAASLGAGWGGEDCICLEVSDTGCGMDQRVISRIFDPFFSTKCLGRGLGLAAVAGIVRAHGGTIEVESAPGSGSTFRIYFPVSAPAKPSEKAKARAA